MSATQELLAEQIRNLNAQITEAAARGEDVTMFHEQLVQLNRQLAAATQALNESKTLLKG